MASNGKVLLVPVATQIIDINDAFTKHNVKIVPTDRYVDTYPLERLFSKRSNKYLNPGDIISQDAVK